jgi:hypothetical protein
VEAQHDFGRASAQVLHTRGEIAQVFVALSKVRPPPLGGSRLLRLSTGGFQPLGEGSRLTAWSGAGGRCSCTTSHCKRGGRRSA